LRSSQKCYGIWTRLALQPKVLWIGRALRSTYTQTLQLLCPYHQSNKICFAKLRDNHALRYEIYDQSKRRAPLWCRLFDTTTLQRTGKFWMKDDLLNQRRWGRYPPFAVIIPPSYEGGIKGRRPNVQIMHIKNIKN